jgi:hypothetical protein
MTLVDANCTQTISIMIWWGNYLRTLAPNFCLGTNGKWSYISYPCKIGELLKYMYLLNRISGSACGCLIYELSSTLSQIESRGLILSFVRKRKKINSLNEIAKPLFIDLICRVLTAVFLRKPPKFIIALHAATLDDLLLFNLHKALTTIVTWTIMRLSPAHRRSYLWSLGTIIIGFRCCRSRRIMSASRL